MSDQQTASATATFHFSDPTALRNISVASLAKEFLVGTASGTSYAGKFIYDTINDLNGQQIAHSYRNPHYQLVVVIKNTSQKVTGTFTSDDTVNSFNTVNNDGQWKDTSPA